MFPSLRSAAILIILLLGAVPLSAETSVHAGEAAATRASPGDWNQFRGPHRSGISAEAGLAKQWPEGGPAILWQRPLGEGFSAISAAGDLICTSFAVDEKEYLGCFSKLDGGERWRVAIGEKFNENFGNGPRATPTIDGEAVFALGSKGRLLVADLATGKVSWQLELTEKYRISAPQSLAAVNPTPAGHHLPVFGYSSSPLVEGDLLILQTGAGAGRSIVALDKHSGEERWTVFDDEIGYSSPIAVDLNGRRQVVVVTGTQVAGVSLDGELLWQQEWPTSSSQPVFLPPDRIFLSTVNDVGAMVFQIDANGSEPAVNLLWKLHKMRNAWNSSLVFEDHIYGFDNATLRCITVKTGELKWARRGLGQGTLILADGLLIVLGDRGRVTVAAASPDGYEEKTSVQVLDGRSWTAPALSGGILYLRNHETMAAVELRATGG